MNDKELKLKLKEMKQELSNLKISSPIGLGLVDFCKKALSIPAPGIDCTVHVTAKSRDKANLIYIISAIHQDNVYGKMYFFITGDKIIVDGEATWDFYGSSVDTGTYVFTVIGSGMFDLTYKIEAD